MKHFTEQTFENVLSPRGIKVSEYVSNSREYENGLLVRPIHVNDYNKGLLELMFDDVKTIDDGEKERVFKEYLAIRNQCPGMYYTVVVEDLKGSNIIASGTLIIEQKFIHETALRGRIENVIVDPNHRRRKVGSIVLGSLSFIAEKLGCYKSTLTCSPEAALFCEKMKYLTEPGQNSMLITFDQSAKHRNGFFKKDLHHKL